MGNSCDIAGFESLLIKKERHFDENLLTFKNEYGTI